MTSTLSLVLALLVAAPLTAQTGGPVLDLSRLPTAAQLPVTVGDTIVGVRAAVRDHPHAHLSWRSSNPERIRVVNSGPCGGEGTACADWIARAPGLDTLVVSWATEGVEWYVITSVAPPHPASIVLQMDGEGIVVQGSHRQITAVYLDARGHELYRCPSSDSRCVPGTVANQPEQRP
jgi:hypothetical protein